MRTLRIFTCSLAAALLATASAHAAKLWVFAYFKEPGTQGIYLALSRDGYHYTPLNDGQPWITPAEPGELMRDVFITRNPTGPGFRMVWTWGWKGNSVGYADSPDLLHWSPQRKLPIMSAFPGIRNTWAPEIDWDRTRKDWLMIWSSSFNDQPESLRIWSLHTTDFRTYSKPSIFFDRGFPVIDATIFHRRFHGKRDFVLVVKDQTNNPLRYCERWAAAPTVDGPWGSLSAPIDESWSEGPSVIQVGKRYLVFYDHYRPPHPRYEAVATTDWVHWTSIDNQIALPTGAKHGSFFQVTEAEARTLLARHDPPSASDTHTEPAQPVRGPSPL